MPNWKNPCQICKNCVRKNQKYLPCLECGKRTHFKCTELSLTEYYILKNGTPNFFCHICKPLVNENANTQGSLLNNTSSIDPCIECKIAVEDGQKAIMCDKCCKWVHLTCTDLSEDQYTYLEQTEGSSFFCLFCEPRSLYSENQVIECKIAVEDG